MFRTIILTITEYKVMLGILGINLLYGFNAGKEQEDLTEDEVKTALFNLVGKGLIRVESTTVDSNTVDRIVFTPKALPLKNIKRSYEILTVENREDKGDNLCLYRGDFVTCIRYKGITKTKVYITGFRDCIQCLDEMEILPENYVADDILYKSEDISREYQDSIQELKETAALIITGIDVGKNEFKTNKAIYISTTELCDLIIEAKADSDKVYEYSPKMLSVLMGDAIHK